MLEEVKVNDVYEVVILKQDHFGRGIVKVKNIFVFVIGALPQEICKIEITNVKKTFAIAKIKEMIKPSIFRVEPECPYYDICGGCHIMHQEYSKQLTFKEEKVRELLQKFTGLKDINMFPIVGLHPFYYRNKVVLHGKNHQLGFYQEKTNRLVPIKKCLITEQKINMVYSEIEKFLIDNPKDEIKHLMIRSTSLNEFLVVIEGKISKEKIIPYLETVSTIYLNNKLVKGNPYIEEEILGIVFKIYPDSFFQVNYDMMLVLYRIVLNYYQNKEYDKVLDLYCGTGTIGMLVSNSVKEVIGVEKEPSSIKSANLCKELNEISNIRFIKGKVEDKIDSFQDIDSIIVDPPRSGLDNHTLEIIVKLHPQSITYISCDPVTLSRDLKTLLDYYDLQEVHPVDMFPNTYHVETIVFLERKKERTFKNYAILVNKDHVYNEKDFDGMVLVATQNIKGNKIFVEKITYSHYLEFKNALKELGIEVSIMNGYRSLEEQSDSIQKISNNAEDQEKSHQKLVSVGTSEHHTGLALDIIILDRENDLKKHTQYDKEENIDISKYEIMAKICSDYGFILRYPKDKVGVTGYRYEPWHFRYVGRKIAKIIMNNHITLEEYFGKE